MKIEDIKTIEDAKIYAENPTVSELKCCNCGFIKNYDLSIPYLEQASCPNCKHQMLGNNWAGWHNRWRRLALYLINGKEHL